MRVVPQDRQCASIEPSAVESSSDVPHCSHAGPSFGPPAPGPSGPSPPSEPGERLLVGGVPPSVGASASESSVSRCPQPGHVPCRTRAVLSSNPTSVPQSGHELFMSVPAADGPSGLIS